MAEVFGDFREKRTLDQEYLAIGFSPESLPIQTRWKTNGLSADFLGDYMGTFFPGDEKEARFKREEVRGGVSYIANELLENAMKYNHAPASAGIQVCMELDPTEIRFYVTNSVSPEDCDRYQALINRMLTEDPGDLLIEQLERNAEDDAADGSGLGFLTMLNDYEARLAWKFENVGSWQNVTTLVRLPV